MLIEAAQDRLHIHLSRRELLRTAGLLGAAGLLPATGGPALAAASNLNILFTGGSWKEAFDSVYAAPFGKANGVQIVYSLGAYENQVSQVIAQRQNERFDLLHMDQFSAASLEQLNLMVVPDAKIVTNLADVDPAFKFSNFVGKIVTPFGLAANTKRIGRKITSWKDLWDPALAGKIGLPKWEWLGSKWFYTVNRVWGGTEDNIDPGLQRCRDLIHKNNAIIVTAVDHAHTLLLQEDAWLLPLQTRGTFQARDDGAPVEFVFPDEGALSLVVNVGIIKGRPQDSEELAQKFVNYTLDPAKQVEFSAKTLYPPTNRKALAMLPKDSPVLLTPSQLGNLNKIRFDIPKLVANRNLHAERWDKEVLGG
jgi:putative spermidine/putrescine transport system substrate-binding protein